MSMTDDGDRDLASLLADPSLWLEPDPASENWVLDAIRAERPAGPARVATLRPRKTRWSTHAAAAVLGAAAAGLIVFAATRSDRYDDDDVAAEPDATVVLSGTGLAPGFTGSAEVSTQSSGVLIRLTMPGLPRRDGDDFYEGWLKSCDGQRLVPIGTFHDMDRAAGWAGVSVDDYPLLTVTAEHVAGPKDVAQGSSGEVVVAGAISQCPSD